MSHSVYLNECMRSDKMNDTSLEFNVHLADFYPFYLPDYLNLCIMGSMIYWYSILSDLMLNAR